MEGKGLEKSHIYHIGDTFDYDKQSVVSKVITGKSTGNITVVSVDVIEPLFEKIVPYDTLVQVLDGETQVIINNKPFLLQTGDIIIIPAHSKRMIKSPVRCKIMISVIKSGYE